MNLTTIAAYPGSGAGCASAVRAEAMGAALKRQADSIDAQVWEAAGYPAKPTADETPLVRWLRQATDEELRSYNPGHPFRLPECDPGHTHDLRDPGACHPVGIFGPPEAHDDGAHAHSFIPPNFHP
jgi:hypothetical protein